SNSGFAIKDNEEVLSIFVKDGGSVGIKTDNPSTDLDVNGTTKAEYFIGDGRHLTNLSANNISGGVISSERLYAATTSQRGITLLSNSYSSTSTDRAVTPLALKNGLDQKLSFTSKAQDSDKLDGFSHEAFAKISNLGNMSSQNNNSVDIDGGSISGVSFESDSASVKTLYYGEIIHREELAGSSSSGGSLSGDSLSLNKQPAARITLGSNQTHNRNSWEKIYFDQETFDTSHLHSNSNKGRITVSSSGYYHISAQLMYTNQDGYGYDRGVRIVKNNNPNDIVASLIGSWLISTSTVVHLNANDFLEVFGYSQGNDATYRTVNRDQSFFTVAKLY
ncbi:hypothetical protein DID80_06975, partial [Candidatus Marinamargulisbacteria bacterium SCGC AAA071-K20]